MHGNGKTVIPKGYLCTCLLGYYFIIINSILLGQHETETGQLFDEKVKQKICQITANQPGLVNGFAQKLTRSEERRVGKEC